jgi:hypothetical protein
MAKKQSARILLQNGGGHDRVSWALDIPERFTRFTVRRAPAPQP